MYKTLKTFKMFTIPIKYFPYIMNKHKLHMQICDIKRGTHEMCYVIL